jgi:hypothetical protein
MPLPNRVTPFGEIIAVSQRGALTGNRGIIHDPATRTLLRWRWASKAWIICRCHYKGVKRAVMATQELCATAAARLSKRRDLPSAHR